MFLYKRICVDISYTYNSGVDSAWGCNNVYCESIDDYPINSLRFAAQEERANYGVRRVFLAIGYTYTFKFKIGNTYETRTIAISPTQQELLDGLMNLVFNL